MASPDTWPLNVASFNDSEGSSYPAELFAGESDIVTQPMVASAAIAIFQPVMLDSSNAGKIKPWDGTNLPGDGALTVLPVPIGIACHAIASGDTGAVFTGGFFNGDTVTSPIDWSATSTGANTFLKRQHAFIGSGIRIGRPKGSNERMTFP